MADLLYRVIRPYECQVCHSGNLMFIDYTGRMIGYKYFIDHAMSAQNLKQSLYRTHVKFLQCEHCRRIFLIDWTGAWPTAVTDLQILQNFGVIK